MNVSQINVGLLAACQALMMIGGSLMVTTAALIGTDLASTAALATLPLALLYLTTMAVTFPASLLMKRVGRRNGFLVGASAGLAGAIASAFAIYHGSFLLFCFGAIGLGTSNGFGQFYRFAAADTASPEFKSRAISLVLAGGVVAAFIGPNIAHWTSGFVGKPFVGGFTTLAGAYVLMLIIISALRIPQPSEEERSGHARSLREIAAQPAFIVAVMGGLIGYGVMNLVMTATPLAMRGHGHTLAQTGFVIQWHMLGMFVPSFFTGNIIRRFGVLNVMLAGAVLLATCVAINFMGREVMHFWAALIALGLGWNFLYIGGTTLLTETHQPAEKAKTQALNDFTVFATVASTAFASGAIHHRFGWEMVNAGVLPMIAIAAGACVWLKIKRAAPAVLVE